MDILLIQLSQIIIYAGIAQGFFVALLLNSKTVKRSRANLFLSMLLIALSFSIAHIVYAQQVFSHLSIQVYSFGDPTFFIIAPFLWLYSKELTGQQVRLTWNIALHFLPFLFIITASLLIKSGELLLFLSNHYKIANILFWILVVVQFSVYQFFIRRKWASYQALIQQEVSNTEDVSISWVKFFMGIFLVINVFFLFSLFAAIHIESITWLTKSVAVIFSLSIFALGYKGILQKEIFYTVLNEKPSVIAQPEVIAENKQNPEHIDKLRAYIIEKKPYLDPELTLSSLAKELNFGRSQLSQLINEGIGDNFYNFINKNRVEEVKKLMVDPKKQNFNMLGLALEAGFKSKSTFNLIFKRFTGLTPTEYRNNLSQKDVH